MNFRIVKDILKCAKLAIFITLGIAVFFMLIFYIFYGVRGISLLNFIKNALYYIGSFGLLISTGFFVQKNGTRPLANYETWKKMFSNLNLGFVIMFISLFICLYGMFLQICIGN